MEVRGHREDAKIGGHGDQSIGCCCVSLEHKGCGCHSKTRRKTHKDGPYCWRENPKCLWSMHIKNRCHMCSSYYVKFPIIFWMPLWIINLSEDNNIWIIAVTYGPDLYGTFVNKLKKYVVYFAVLWEVESCSIQLYSLNNNSQIASLPWLIPLLDAFGKFSPRTQSFSIHHWSCCVHVCLYTPRPRWLLAVLHEPKGGAVVAPKFNAASSFF